MEEPWSVRHTTHKTCSSKLWTDAQQHMTRLHVSVGRMHLVEWQRVQAYIALLFSRHDAIDALHPESSDSDYSKTSRPALLDA